MKNKYMLTLSLIFLFQSAFATTYQYKNSVLKEILRGCKNSGGSKSMCMCQIDVFTNNIPQSELVGFNKSMYILYSNSDTKIPQQHRIWIQKLMNKCKGL